ARFCWFRRWPTDTDRRRQKNRLSLSPFLFWFAAILVLGACSNTGTESQPLEALTRLFPEHAARVGQGAEAFASSGEGFKSPEADRRKLSLIFVAATAAMDP